MVDQMGAQPGDHVLEIGCGWGGFAEYAAKERGLRVTGLTISQAQHDYAVDADRRRRACRDRVEIKLQDYRDERGIYDGIASIEMFEAVGEKYWPVYFDTLRDRLKPGRHATLADHHRRTTSAGRSTSAAWISSRNTSSRAACCPRPSVLRAEVERPGCASSGSIEFGAKLQPDAAALARDVQRPLGRDGGDGL